MDETRSSCPYQTPHKKEQLLPAALSFKQPVNPSPTHTLAIHHSPSDISYPFNLSFIRSFPGRPPLCSSPRPPKNATYNLTENPKLPSWKKILHHLPRRYFPTPALQKNDPRIYAPNYSSFHPPSFALLGVSTFNAHKTSGSTPSIFSRRASSIPQHRTSPLTPPKSVRSEVRYNLGQPSARAPERK